MKRSLRIGAISLIPLAFIGLVIFQLVQNRDTEIQFRPTPVLTGFPEVMDLQESLQYSGNLKPERTTNIIPKISGRILDIPVNEGAVVQRGQLLVQQEDDVVRLQAAQARSAWLAAQAQYEKAQQGARPEEIASARASVQQARSNLQNARTNLERTANLFEAGAISRSAYEDAQTRFSSAQTEVENAQRSLQLLEEGVRSEDLASALANAEAAERQYELAELQRSYAQIHSPVTGRVVSIHVEEGNLVGPQSPVMTIISDDVIFATLNLPERLYGRVALSDSAISVAVKPIAYPQEPPFQGTISRIGTILNPATRTFEVEIAVDNQSELLRPGMYVNARLTLDTIPDALVVPDSAVLQRETRYLVFSVEEQDDGSWNAQMHPVVPGISSNGYTQILEGITPEDRIIIEGNSFLEDGQEVSLIQEGNS